jgi:hypothetical protein
MRAAKFAPLAIHGSTVFAHPRFMTQVEALVDQVEAFVEQVEALVEQVEALVCKSRHSRKKTRLAT